MYIPVFLYFEHSFTQYYSFSKKLVDRLHLKEDFRVLEIGPGYSFFSIEVAQRIPKRHLELFDIQKEMLNIASKRFKVKWNL